MTAEQPDAEKIVKQAVGNSEVDKLSLHADSLPPSTLSDTEAQLGPHELPSRDVGQTKQKSVGATDKTGSIQDPTQQTDSVDAEPLPKKTKPVCKVARGFVTFEMRQALFGQCLDVGSSPQAAPDPAVTHADQQLETAGGCCKDDDDDDDIGKSIKTSKTKKRRRPMSTLSDGAVAEISREKAGLRLVREQAPEGLCWKYPLVDELRRCFVGHLESALDAGTSERLLAAALADGCWLQPEGRFGKMPRQTQWMVKSPCCCKYGYGGHLVEPKAFAPWVEEAMSTCMHFCGLTNPAEWPNSCNLNLYEDGSQSVAWHADDETLFQGMNTDCLIISLSLGRARRFDLQLVSEPLEVYSLPLRAGDICTMEGLTQKHYQHQVPKMRGVGIGPRVNLTWRWVKAHHRSCPLFSGTEPEAHPEDVVVQRKRRRRSRPIADIEETYAGLDGQRSEKRATALESSSMSPKKSKAALKKISKQLVKVLQQQSAGQEMETSSCNVEQVLASKSLQQLGASLADIQELVLGDSTGRYLLQVSEAGTFLKDTRGRIADSDRGHAGSLGLRKLCASDTDIPMECMRGTLRERWPRVLQRGFLLSGSAHVHFATSRESEDRATGLCSDAAQVVVYFDVREAISDGMDIFLGESGSVLASGFDGAVPPKYFMKAIDLGVESSPLWVREKEG